MQGSKRRPAGRLFYWLCTIVLVAVGLRASDTPPATTLIQDVVYRANGTPAGGTVVISWPAFATAEHKAVAAGVLTVKIGEGGVLSVPLVPNQGSTPEATYYKVVIKLDDGTTNTELWNVPNISPTTIAAVRTTLSVGPPTAPSQNFVQQAEVSEAPLPNRIPRAGNDGRLRYDWLPSYLGPSSSEFSYTPGDLLMDLNLGAAPYSFTLRNSSTKKAALGAFNQYDIDPVGGTGYAALFAVDDLRPSGNAHGMVSLVGSAFHRGAVDTWADGITGYSVQTGSGPAGLRSVTGWFSVGNHDTASTWGDVSLAAGFYGSGEIAGAAGTHVGRGVSLWAEAPYSIGSSTIDETAGVWVTPSSSGAANYGVKIDDVAAGQNNYAIYAPVGKTRLQSVESTSIKATSAILSDDDYSVPGGRMAMASNGGDVAQGYVISNWAHLQSDAYQKDGGSSLIIFGIKNSPAESVAPGDIAFHTAPTGTGGTPVTWTRKFQIYQNNPEGDVGLPGNGQKFFAPFIVATNGGASFLAKGPAGVSAGIGFAANAGPSTALMATAGAPNDVLSGTAVGDLVVRSAGKDIWFTTDSGVTSSLHLAAGSPGAAIFGGNVSTAGYVDVSEIAAPANPASGVERWYASSASHTLRCLTSSGGDCAPSGGGGVTSFSGDGTLAANSGSTGAVTLSLANAAAGTVFGNPTGSAANPIHTTKLALAEGAAPAGLASIDLLYPDSTAHRWKMINNNGTAAQVVASGADINTSDQVTATHLAAALPVNQGGTGTTGTLTGLVRGSGSAMTAAEISGDCTTSGSNAITCTKTNNVAFAAAATSGYALTFGSSTGTSMAACSNGGGTTSFIGLGGSTNTTEASVIRFLVPVSGTLKNFNVKLSANVPASQSAAFKVSKNGSTSGTPAVTVGAGASTGTQDTSTTTAVVAGDLISVAVTCSGGNTALTGPVVATMMVQ